MTELGEIFRRIDKHRFEMFKNITAQTANFPRAQGLHAALVHNRNVHTSPIKRLDLIRARDYSARGQLFRAERLKVASAKTIRNSCSIFRWV